VALERAVFVDFCSRLAWWQFFDFDQALTSSVVSRSFDEDSTLLL
jgi:hypothetical protein